MSESPFAETFASRFTSSQVVAGPAAGSRESLERISWQNGYIWRRPPEPVRPQQQLSAVSRTSKLDRYRLSLGIPINELEKEWG